MDQSRERNLAMISHMGGLVPIPWVPIIVPFLVWILKGDESDPLRLFNFYDYRYSDCFGRVQCFYHHQYCVQLKRCHPDLQRLGVPVSNEFKIDPIKKRGY